MTSVRTIILFFLLPSLVVRAADLTRAAQHVDAASVTVPDSPGLGASLEIWLRASTLAMDDGQPVSTWSDASGRHHDMVASRLSASDATPRLVKQSALRLRPAVRFGVDGGFSSSPANPVSLHGDMAATFFVVMNLRPAEASPGFATLLGIGDPAPPVDPGKALAAAVIVDRVHDHALSLAGGWNHDATLGAGSFRRFYDRSIILTVVKEPGPMSATTRFFINGEDAGIITGLGAGDRNALPDVQPRADLGAFIGRAAPWAGGFSGDVGEIILYNRALSTLERQGVEKYLTDEFALDAKRQIAETRAKFTRAEAAHWAYEPVKDSTPPDVDGSALPIDRFINARLKVEGITPSQPADRRTLIRRVSFDLIGLPPTPQEVDAFVNDSGPDAYARVVDRLLASPHYGEAWGRHWLDVVRYADTTANDANAVMRYAWRYRNYVIDSFKRDLPYDQFLIEQIAGDVLPPSADAAENLRRTIASGYLMIGPKALAETDKEQTRLDIVDDQIDVTSRAMLGLTVSCARCHDHKFDAIRTADYYALAGIFRSTDPFQNEERNASMWWEYPVKVGEKSVMVMAPKDAQPRNLRVHLRGSHFNLGAEIPRGFLQVIDAQPPQLAAGESGRVELARWIASPGNPLTARVMVNRIWQHHFARGLVASSDNFGTRGDKPTHPELLDWLAARFIEGRWSVKSMHRLIVMSQTYQRQSAPTETAAQRDPDDRLLSFFPRQRLSAEQLRDSMLYIAGDLDVSADQGESAEALWARAEAPTPNAAVRPNRLTGDDAYYNTFARRTIYMPVVRNSLPDALALFDEADPNSVAAVRNETTVPLQSLFLMNNPLVRDQTQRLASRLLNDRASDDERINWAHQLVLGRPPRDDESAQARQFLSAYLHADAATARTEPQRRLAAWQSYCQVLFCQNEFLYCN